MPGYGGITIDSSVTLYVVGGIEGLRKQATSVFTKGSFVLWCVLYVVSMCEGIGSRVTISLVESCSLLPPPSLSLKVVTPEG